MSRNKIIGVAAGLFLAGLAVFLLAKPDPKKAFLREIDSMVQTTNEGGHLKLAGKFSPDAVDLIQNSGLTLQQALWTVQKQDVSGQRRYRFRQLKLFQPNDYAEVLFQRSEPGGGFSADSGLFCVPFIYLNKTWLVAGGFRSGDQELSLPP